MTGNLTENRMKHLQKTLAALDDEFARMQPLLRQMHLLSANAVSAAARAGSDGDAFRVLTQAIQQLGQDISQDLQQAQGKLEQLKSEKDITDARVLIRQLDDGLSAMPLAIKKGEYLAICSSVEAAHAETHGDSFDAVARMLKDLVNRLRQRVTEQQTLLERLRAAE